MPSGNCPPGGGRPRQEHRRVNEWFGDRATIQDQFDLVMASLDAVAQTISELLELYCALHTCNTVKKSTNNDRSSGSYTSCSLIIFCVPFLLLLLLRLFLNFRRANTLVGTYKRAITFESRRFNCRRVPAG